MEGGEPLPGATGLVKDDVWVNSSCYMCVNCCGIKAHRVNGVVVKIEGDPKNPHNYGKICAKGASGIGGLYDPYRVKVPLKRTNPEKGIGVDPKWVEVSWEEALDAIAARLRKIRDDDPRKLMLTSFDVHDIQIIGAWCAAFGTPNVTPWSADFYCGNGLHPVLYMTQGAFYGEPDLEHCDYCIYFGTQWGTVIQSNPMHMARLLSEARHRGMKLVVVDPTCSTAASIADEWLPIRPGTDAALALSLVNQLLNESGVYDAPFIKRHTNGPYLVGDDGYYVRDKKTGKPLVWDTDEGKARPFDDPALKDVAIDGEFEVDAAKCKPAFQRLKEHVRKYTPEFASQITTIPADTIRRIAEEFGEAAKVGSTIIYDGKELPLRPACATWHRGPSGHKHGYTNGICIELLNMMVGAVDVPGGLLGNNPVGPWWGPKPDSDGMLVAPKALAICELSYPPRKAKKPERLDLFELFPIASYSAPILPLTLIKSKEIPSVEYEPEMLIQCRNNPVFTSANPQAIAEGFKRVPFMVSFATELHETAELADIVLPDTHYLEKLEGPPINHPAEYLPAGPGYWFWQMSIPAVKPAFGRNWVEVLLALAERAGFLDDVYEVINSLCELKEPYMLEQGERYSWEEIADRRCRSLCGPENGLDVFKKQGVVVVRRKTVEEAYPRPFLSVRTPIYFEHIKKAGDDVGRVLKESGFQWDLSDYSFLPGWHPCPDFEAEGECDLFVVSSKVATHTLCFTPSNPLLMDLSDRQEWHKRLLMHPETARRKGLKDGDEVWLENKIGHRVKGRLRLTECINPEVIQMTGGLGHWARRVPVAKGKGSHWNELITLSIDRIDAISSALDSCVRVRVYKA